MVAPTINGQSSHPNIRLPPTALTNISQVLASLSALENEETELSQSLSSLLSSREPIFNVFAALQSLTPQVDHTLQDATYLASKVAVTAETAERIGSKVARLDEIKQIRPAFFAPRLTGNVFRY